MPYDDTVEIYTLWNRLKQRFSIIAPQPKSFNLQNTVQPVTNVDFALITTVLYHDTPTLTFNGITSLLTVPDGKRWDLSISSLQVGTGTFDIDNFIIRSGGSAISYEQFTAAQTHLFYHPHPLLLSEGDILGVNVTNFVSSGTLGYSYWVKETNLEE